MTESPNGAKRPQTAERPYGAKRFQDDRESLRGKTPPKMAERLYGAKRPQMTDIQIGEVYEECKT